MRNKNIVNGNNYVQGFVCIQMLQGFYLSLHELVLYLQGIHLDVHFPQVSYQILYGEGHLQVNLWSQKTMNPCIILVCINCLGGPGCRQLVQMDHTGGYWSGSYGQAECQSEVRILIQGSRQNQGMTLLRSAG